MIAVKVLGVKKGYHLVVALGAMTALHQCNVLTYRNTAGEKRSCRPSPTRVVVLPMVNELAALDGDELEIAAQSKVALD